MAEIRRWPLFGSRNAQELHTKIVTFGGKICLTQVCKWVRGKAVPKLDKVAIVSKALNLSEEEIAHFIMDAGGELHA